MRTIGWPRGARRRRVPAGPAIAAGCGGPPAGADTADLSGLAVGFLAGSTAGGTGRHVLMLARGCAARGATVTVYGPPSLGEPGGLRFRTLDIGDRPRPAHDARAVTRLRRWLAHDAPAVLHAHGLRAGALAALALAGRPARRTALVVTAHNAPPAGRAAAVVYAVLELIVARRAAAVLPVSADLAGRLRRRGARIAGPAVIAAPAAPDPSPERTAAVRRELGAVGRPVVLAAGRLAAQKGFGTLLGAAARWQRRDPVPLLVIAGDGPLGPALRAQARAAGTEVRFLGPRPDVPELLAAADVVVVPSSWEGQPLIVQETLRAGRPLVASRAGGIADLTGADGAVLIPPGDPAALAAAVTRLLDDPQQAAALAAAARRRAAGLPGEATAVDRAAAVYMRLRPAGN
ncbi:MAG TPA: glycosyltransferase family 4 protein [Streptosporangiaceae bacterium]|nr:glycosyltransferase family 4 protein [Streptosporangiaceae bacterium]